MPWSARNAELRYWWRRYVRLYMEKRQQRYRSDHARKRGEPRRYRGEMPIGLRLTLAAGAAQQPRPIGYGHADALLSAGLGRSKPRT